MYDFQVALSFAGEQRSLAAAVADRLAAAVGRDQVFYDRYHEAELARPDLDIYLQAVYLERSRLVVVFLGKDYERKQWPGLEWRVVRDLIRQRATERIVLVRIDDAPVPGVFGLDGFLDAQRLSAQQIANYILERLRHRDLPSLVAPASRSPTTSTLPQLDIGRLPTSSTLFVGRERELARLDAAWEDTSPHVLTFAAFGGVGKSSLVGRWLDGMAADGWRGARWVLDWSFNSQGSEERVTSAERFLETALRFFGDPDPQAGAARDRGLRLAELVRREKTLLVLDGIEPLQHPPRPLGGGRLKDPGLAALLTSLAGSNAGLCVVTTRERIGNLESFPETAPQVNLETLSPEAGAQLLGQLGVKGKDSELRAAAGELGNHALALTLIGNYLRRALCRRRAAAARGGSRAGRRAAGRARAEGDPGLLPLAGRG